MAGGRPQNELSKAVMLPLNSSRQQLICTIGTVVGRCKQTAMEMKQKRLH